MGAAFEPSPISQIQTTGGMETVFHPTTDGLCRSAENSRRGPAADPRFPESCQR